MPQVQSAPATPQSPQQNSSRPAPNADSKSSQEKRGIPVRLPAGKKLVLIDGTFHLVREYSVQGDRVRYWSVERSAWEEIPASLVDWDATRKAEAEQEAQDTVLKKKIHESEVAARTRDINVDRSLEISTGLFLPDGVGFYALDNKLVLEMKQNQANSQISMGREVERIITGVPVIPRKQVLEISGARAVLRLTTAEPEFFMRPADEREPHFRLLRAQVKGGQRVLENVSISISGNQARQAHEIEFLTWTPARGVFRYTINERLEPGEYAFVEMTSEGTNSYVWDFGIDAPGTKARK
jgi:hypothetical protein